MRVSEAPDPRLTGLSSDDPLFEIAEAANDLLDRVETANREVLGAMGAAREGRYHRQYIGRGMTGSFRPVADAISAALQSLEAQERVIDKAKGSIAALSRSLSVEVGERTGELLASSEELARTSEGVVASTRTCSAMSEAGVTAAHEALQGSEQIAAATEELAASIREIGSQSHQSKAVSERAVQEVMRAQQVMAEVTAAAAAVNSIVGVISEIARQTNLLALNAAIEAARAGDAGRGFGVVAAEVKELASQTRDSTRDISVRIGGVGEAVTRGSRAVEDISAALEQLVAFVNNISSAIYEQDTVTTEIANGSAKRPSSTAACSKPSKIRCSTSFATRSTTALSGPRTAWPSASRPPAPSASRPGTAAAWCSSRSPTTARASTPRPSATAPSARACSARPRRAGSARPRPWSWCSCPASRPPPRSPACRGAAWAWTWCGPSCAKWAARSTFRA
jgi:methyl-accepting chemotaxis protein